MTLGVDPDALGRSVRRIAAARRLAVLTGAGISAESGIRTFRDADGLWNGARPEEVATPEAFARDPLRVWEWYEGRRRQARDVEPNRGHFALARLGRAVASRGGEFTLVTQNVDGLHWRAAEAETPSGPIHEVHGSLTVIRCSACSSERRDLGPIPELPPRCARCGALERPGVVWFGETLPMEPWIGSEQAVRACDVLLVVGTSGVVWPVAGLPGLARASGGFVIEVNPEETPVSRLADAVFRGAAGEVLPRLAAAVRGLSRGSRPALPPRSRT